MRTPRASSETDPAASLESAFEPASLIGAPDATATSRPVLIHRPELDALRGIAVLLVMGGHFYFPGIVGGGNVGVTLFFVLSGYLITSILRENGDLIRFYARRARRLLPALIAWLAVMVLAGVVTFTEALPPLLYVANWSSANGTLAAPLAHTWSLAVEEQFYLIWPLALIMVRRPVWLAVTVIFIGAVGGVLLPTDLLALELGRFGAIAWGCLLGLGFVPKLPRPIAVGALAVIVVFVVAPPVGPLSNTLGPILSAATFAIMSVIVRRDTGPLALRPLMAVGQISYGLYLWHLPFALVTDRLLHPSHVATPGRLDDVALALAAFGATFGCAITSWVFVERRWLQTSWIAGHSSGRRRRSPFPPGVPPAPASAE